MKIITMTYLAVQFFNLTYLDRFSIENIEAGLVEPSGLVLSPQKDALWTVSDDTRKIFQLTLDGKIQKSASFGIPDAGLEGITLDPSGVHLLAVKEENNAVIKARIDTQQVVDRRQIADMAGYDSIAQYFTGSEANKGLEGISWNSKTDTVFLLKEGRPGLLIEVSSNLQEILSHQRLNKENGFHDPEVDAAQLDFSGLCYDQRRDRFWVVSDKARRLFLYDWKRNQVIQSTKLAYGKKGRYREIEKAEGVAIDPDANRLYVVSDEEARLYVFDLRD